MLLCTELHIVWSGGNLPLWAPPTPHGPYCCSQRLSQLVDQAVESTLEMSYLVQDVISMDGKLMWGLFFSDSVVLLTHRPYCWYFKWFPIVLRFSDLAISCLSQMQNVSHPRISCCQSCILDVADEFYLQIASAHPVTKLIDSAGKISFLLVGQQFYWLWMV